MSTETQLEVVATDSSSPDLSVEAERLVARQFMGRVQWEAIVIGLGQASLWVVNLWCAFTGVYSLTLGFLISTLCCCVAYLPSHEGQHHNISGDKKSLRWLDNIIGHITVITLGFSHSILKVTHMKHHAYTNDPEKDVDVNNAGDHWWNPVIGVHRGVAKKTLEYHANPRDPSHVS